VEYVAPQSPATRMDSAGKSRARNAGQGPVDVPVTPEHYRNAPAPTSSMAPPVRPARDDYRAASENIITKSTQAANRPATGGSITGRLPSRSSYGQPAVAVAKEQAQGRISQPRLASYNHDERRGNRHSYIEPSNTDPNQIGFPQTYAAAVPGNYPKKGQGHKRSNTLSGIGEKLGFGKRGSIFSSRTDEEKDLRKSKKYPPVSMSRPIPNDNAAATAGAMPSEPRKSTESRRPSFSLSRKPKDNSPQSEKSQNVPGNRSSRRFSFIPSFGRKDDKSSDGSHATSRADQRPRIAFGRGESRSSSQSTNDASILPLYDSAIDGSRGVSRKPVPKQVTSHPQNYPNYPTLRTYAADQDSQSEQEDPRALTASTTREQQHNTFPGMEYDDPEPEQQLADSPPQSQSAFPSRPSSKPSVLHKRRNFNDAYEQEGGHSGSSGAAKKVMALFTFRRKARSGQ
jgi:protein-serine/threonine kinase